MVAMLCDDQNQSQAIAITQDLITKLKFLEEERVRSFKVWQHGNNENCSTKKMAEAGFYFSGITEDDDSATCFVCGKDLDGWEKTDEPWREHEKHAPNCPFVRWHKSQDDLTVEQVFSLAAIVLKGHISKTFNAKLTTIKKRSDDIRDNIKKQS